MRPDRSSLRFTLESLKGMAVSGQFLREQLQGDGAMEFGVLGFVDDTHPHPPSFSTIL
jgi:hypothetical protein